MVPSPQSSCLLQADLQPSTQVSNLQPALTHSNDVIWLEKSRVKFWGFPLHLRGVKCEVACLSMSSTVHCNFVGKGGSQRQRDMRMLLSNTNRMLQCFKRNLFLRLHHIAAPFLSFSIPWYKPYQNDGKVRNLKQVLFVASPLWHLLVVWWLSTCHLCRGIIFRGNRPRQKGPAHCSRHHA